MSAKDARDLEEEEEEEEEEGEQDFEGFLRIWSRKISCLKDFILLFSRGKWK